MHPSFPVRRAVSALVLLLAFVAVVGCDDSRVRSYSVPKDSSSMRSATSPSSGPSAELLPTWTLPDGWEALPGTGMRFATIRMGPEDHAPEIRVTPLGALAGEPLANVNRWLSQLGAPPIEASDLGNVMRSVSVGEYVADLIRLEGPEEAEDTQQILAAILPVGERVWFFMSQARKADLAPRADAFDRFVQSVDMQPMMPPDHPSVASASEVGSPPSPSGGSSATSPSGGPSELSWRLPAGWVEMPSNSSMRLATFQAGSGEHTAEVTITRFPGDVGGELANVNRWRRQVELPEIPALADQEARDIDLATGRGTYLDLRGPASRMLVVFLPRGGFTWFLKMSGPSDLLGDEKGNFETFVSSVALPGVSG